MLCYVEYTENVVDIVFFILYKTYFLLTLSKCWIRREYKYAKKVLRVCQPWNALNTSVSLEQKEIFENSKQHFSSHSYYLFMF